MFGFYSRKEKRDFGNIIFIVISVFLLYQIVTSYFLTPFVIKHSSMEPEFTSGARILSTPLYSNASLKRGSLVFIAENERQYNFFQKLANALSSFFTFQLYTPFDSNTSPSTKYLLRRIVALPGDVIYMKNFILYIKPQGSAHFLTEFEMAEYDYNIITEGLSDAWSESLPFSGSMEEVTLKEGEYFALCDNRLISLDSRLIGKIDGAKVIKQKVVFRYWPVNKIKIF